MRVDRLGETAAILRDFGADAAAYAESLSLLPGVQEAVACYDTVGVYFETPGALTAAVAQGFPAPSEHQRTGRQYEIPVCYELGDDLAEVADALGLCIDEVVRLHSGHEYRCYAVGFCPGFPYLGYLPEPLRGIPRRPTPRTRIEPGSVAITGQQTGVYPLPRPGGWAIIGRTPCVLVDVDDGYFPIRAGDRIQFRAIELSEFEARSGERL